MTVSATENRKEHAGNGVTTSFATPVFFNESDVVVYLVNDTTGVATLWTLNTEYTLSGTGNASGGTLTVETSPTDYTPASGETLVILTDPTYDQGVDLVNNDALDAEVLEQALDELTVMIQRVDSKIGRAFRFADDAAGTDSVSVDIPTPEASKALRWNSDGDALENVNLSDLGVIATADFAETLLDDPNADAFWATLMASITKTTARTSLGVDSQAHPVTITPDSDTDYTPTATELAADVWELDLSAWTIDRSIILDDVSRKITVINPTTNSRSATVTTNGTTPTTVDIPSDSKYYDLVVRAGEGVDFSGESGVLSANGVIAPHKNLVVKNGTTAASTIDVDADAILLDGHRVVLDVDITVDVTASGANGLDTGSEASSTEYHIWVIYNPKTSTVAGLLSTSSTAPTLPSGYTYKGYVGSIYNNSSGDFVTYHQINKRFYTTTVSALSNGGATSYTSVSLTGIPSLAKAVRGSATLSNPTGAAISDAAYKLSPDSGGVGVTTQSVAAGNDDNLGASRDVPFSVEHIPVFTAQTIYYSVSDANLDLSLSINGGEY